MKISLNWLRQYCEWNWSETELLEKLTMSGLNVEGVVKTGADFPKVVTARITSFVQHPNADRLSVCQVEDDMGTRQIVCGAKNFAAGDIVPLAQPGAVLPGGFEIKKAKLRGETSEGMLCSAKELGIEGDASGLLILPKETPVGKPIGQVLESDTILELEITPNRPDLLSYVGLARHFSAIGATLKNSSTPSTPVFEAIPGWSIAVQAGDFCPRYSAQLFTQIKVGPSPQWLASRLQAIGLRPINNVVDITNYVLFETGQPLHAFDADLLKDKTICVRPARAGEKIEALDGKTYELSAEDGVIADAEKPVAIAGVMGGTATAVSDKTTTISLESATFHPGRVRVTSRRLGVSSDSSYRFERSVAAELAEMGRERAGELFRELCGAVVSGKPFETSPVQVRNLEVAFRPERCRSVLGMNISDARIAELLMKIGCRSVGEKSWKVPGFRPDLFREIDLIEEVAHLEGMSGVKSALPGVVVGVSEADRIYDRNVRLREALAGLGFFEAISSSLQPKRDDGEKAVRLRNPMNDESAELRGSLMPALTACLSRSVMRDEKDVRLFEIGQISHVEAGEIRFSSSLALVAVGTERPAHWSEKERELDFFSMKGIVQRLSAVFPEISGEAEIKALDVPDLRQRVKSPVWGVEIPLLAPGAGDRVKFQPLPAFPSVARDLAFVVPVSITQQQILEATLSCAIQELVKVECFDVFEDADGSKLGPGLKSLAYTLTYRSPVRTLQETEVARWEQQIVQAVTKATGAHLRA